MRWLETVFLEEELKYILNEMVSEAQIDLLFHAYICRADRDKERIQSVTVATINGEEKLQAEYFIDATGDAQLAYLAGCPTVLGRQADHLCQPMTLCFRVGNVNVKAFAGKRLFRCVAVRDGIDAHENDGAQPGSDF